MDVVLLGEIQDLISNVNTNIANTKSVVDTISSNTTTIINNTKTNNTASSTGTLSQKLTHLCQQLGTSSDAASSGTTSGGTAMSKLNAILSKVNSGVTATPGKFAGWQSQGTWDDDNNGYYLVSQAYASGASITSGTVLYSLSNVIFEKDSDVDNAYIYMVGRYGTGTIEVLVDGVSAGSLTLKSTSNPSAQILIPVGIKISSLQIKATTAITWGTNGILLVQMGGPNRTCIAYKVN